MSVPGAIVKWRCVLWIEVFDQQTEDIKWKLDALADFKDLQGSARGRFGQISIRIGSRYYQDFSFTILEKVAMGASQITTSTTE